MQSLNQKQKITVLISGIFIELIIGAVYAYSVIRLQFENELNLNHTQSSIPYLTSLAVFAFMVYLLVVELVFYMVFLSKLYKPYTKKSRICGRLNYCWLWFIHCLSGTTIKHEFSNSRLSTYVSNFRH